VYVRMCAAYVRMCVCVCGMRMCACMYAQYGACARARYVRTRTCGTYAALAADMCGTCGYVQRTCAYVRVAAYAYAHAYVRTCAMRGTARYAQSATGIYKPARGVRPYAQVRAYVHADSAYEACGRLQADRASLANENREQPIPPRSTSER
jgi:hypothetical protein